MSVDKEARVAPKRGRTFEVSRHSAYQRSKTGAPITNEENRRAAKNESEGVPKKPSERCRHVAEGQLAIRRKFT